jgi:hypothetical protein
MILKETFAIFTRDWNKRWLFQNDHFSRNPKTFKQNTFFRPKVFFATTN